jgi:outer membrane receptor protein involved in Fe transport
VRLSANQVSYESVRRDLDLYALWKFDPKLQLRLAVSNLLGRDYLNASSYTLAGDGTQRSRTTYLGAPTLRATLEMKF